jgi:hypothetical protein
VDGVKAVVEESFNQERRSERAGRPRTAAETVAGESERKLPRRPLGERG